jgi:hypothetical protein
VRRGRRDGAVLRFAAAGLSVAIVPSRLLADYPRLRGTPLAGSGSWCTVALAHRRDVTLTNVPARSTGRCSTKLGTSAAGGRFPPGGELAVRVCS